jgi:nucleoside-diphosphate-sugar epimerase
VADNRLLIFGFGYTGLALAKRLQANGWHIAGTSRDAVKRAQLQALGYEALDADADAIRSALTRSTHLLISAPPSESGTDDAFGFFSGRTAHVKWIGYLSTTGVYGDTQGAWVDESTLPAPAAPRTIARVKAETAWLTQDAHIFRLAGIYGPGRNALDQLKKGDARSIYKKDQVFSRIHVDDIATILMASMQKRGKGGIYNICDDEPAASHEVMEYATTLLHLPAPPRIPFEDAHLSDMAKEFYSQNRRVRNGKVKRELGIALAYPTYREGLRALAMPPTE